MDILPKDIIKLIIRLLNVKERCIIMVLNHDFQNIILTPECWWNFHVKYIDYIPDKILKILTQVVRFSVVFCINLYTIYNMEYDKYTKDKYHTYIYSKIFIDSIETVIYNSRKTLQYIDLEKMQFKVSHCHKLKFCKGYCKNNTKISNPLLKRIINSFYENSKYDLPIQCYDNGKLKNIHSKYAMITPFTWEEKEEFKNKVYMAGEIVDHALINVIKTPICLLLLVKKGYPIKDYSFPIQYYDKRQYVIYGDENVDDVCYTYYLNKKEVYRMHLL